MLIQKATEGLFFNSPVAFDIKLKSLFLMRTIAHRFIT